MPMSSTTPTAPASRIPLVYARDIANWWHRDPGRKTDQGQSRLDRAERRGRAHTTPGLMIRLFDHDLDQPPPGEGDRHPRRPLGRQGMRPVPRGGDRAPETFVAARSPPWPQGAIPPRCRPGPRQVERRRSLGACATAPSSRCRSILWGLRRTIDRRHQPGGTIMSGTGFFAGTGGTTRRQFGRAVAGAVAGAFAAPAIVRGRNLNEKLNIAMIGVRRPRRAQPQAVRRREHRGALRRARAGRSTRPRSAPPQGPAVPRLPQALRPRQRRSTRWS